MKLYLISQTENGNYDTYDSAVVCAENYEIARNMKPNNGEQMTEGDWNEKYSCWASHIKAVSCKYLGEAVEGSKRGVVCASFRAG